MAAAPDFFREAVASPELALVDAALAAELRSILHPSEHAYADLAADFGAVSLTAAVTHKSDRNEPVLADQLGYLRAQEDEVEDRNHNTLVTSDERAEDQRATSHYPVLPAPQCVPEGINETDAALQRIRERFTERSP